MTDQLIVRTQSGGKGSLRRGKLVQDVVARLQSKILTEGCAAGNKLPSEGSLCKTFGVSRTVVREAMRTLADRGLIEVAQGQVARIREPDSLVVEASLNTFLKRADYSPLLLMEARRPLETEAAALAAQRATGEQIAALKKCLQPVLTATTIKDQVAAELQFHECLAVASGNPLFVILHRTLTKLIVEWLTKALSAMGLVRSSSKRDPHELIVDAIERRDAAAARNHMQEHFEDAISLVKKII